MKNQFLYTVVLLFVLLSCNSVDKKTQDISENHKDSLAQQSDINIPTNIISNKNDIIKAYENTMIGIKNKTLDSSSFLFDCGGEKTGRIIFYRVGNEIKLIEKIYSEYSHTEAKDQYFISNGKPFFIFKKITNWSFDSDSDAEGATIDKVKQNRYYLIKDELVDCLQKDFIIKSSEKKRAEQNEISNKNSTCPPVDKLLVDFEKLNSYKDQKGNIECL